MKNSEQDFKQQLNGMNDRVQARIAERKQERLRTWQMIQKKAPELARFMTDIHAAFGKPKEAHVWIGKEKVL